MLGLLHFAGQTGRTCDFLRFKIAGVLRKWATCQLRTLTPWAFRPWSISLFLAFLESPWEILASKAFLPCLSTKVWTLEHQNAHGFWLTFCFSMLFSFFKNGGWLAIPAQISGAESGTCRCLLQQRHQCRNVCGGAQCEGGSCAPDEADLGEEVTQTNLEVAPHSCDIRKDSDQNQKTNTKKAKKKTPDSTPRSSSRCSQGFTSWTTWSLRQRLYQLLSLLGCSIGKSGGADDLGSSIF